MQTENNSEAVLRAPSARRTKGGLVRRDVSLILQLIVAACAALGVTLTATAGEGFMASKTAFLYFTIQSNLWIGAVCLLFAVLSVVEFFKRDFRIPRALCIVKYVFTVSITLTGVVFCAVLAPTMKGLAFRSAANILTHVVVPAAAIADLFVFRGYAPRKRNFLWALIPPVYYVIFAGVGYALDWQFGTGTNYPYFFLNWGSPAGAFGFGKGGVYFMGCAWWILVLLVFISAVSIAYLAVLRAMRKRGRQD